jgi:hypothetical protein
MKKKLPQKKLPQKISRLKQLRTARNLLREACSLLEMARHTDDWHEQKTEFLKRVRETK